MYMNGTHQDTFMIHARYMHVDTWDTYWPYHRTLCGPVTMCCRRRPRRSHLRPCDRGRARICYASAREPLGTGSGVRPRDGGTAFGRGCGLSLSLSPRITRCLNTCSSARPPLTRRSNILFKRATPLTHCARTPVRACARPRLRVTGPT